MKRKLSFSAGCLFELSLLVFALLWNWSFHRPILADLHWSLKDMLVGIVAALPPFIFFVWTMNSRLRVLSPHRHLLEALLRPLFEEWSIVQLAVISVCAGVSEEAFFRGAIQGSLAERIGAALALVLASVLFGASHLITWTYAIIAAFIGGYLGWLWLGTGNLLTPMITHAVYDFLALVFFLRVYRPG